MTMDTSHHYAGRALDAGRADRGEDVDQNERILVRKGCVDRSVNSADVIANYLIMFSLVYLRC